MQILLDTHVLIWALSDPKKLSPKARSQIESPENLIYVSVASLWELQIKESINKVSLPKDFFQKMEPFGFEILPIKLSHLQYLRKLPLHHRDPFDRMLIAQANCEALTLMTVDQEIFKYKVKIFEN
jgi:PIN domain nuclease of toxin-antitoxin system